MSWYTLFKDMLLFGLRDCYLQYFNFGGTKKRMGCMEAYGSEWKHRGAYGMVRKVYGTGIKGVCDCKQPLTILFFDCQFLFFKCIILHGLIWWNDFTRQFWS